MVALDMKTVMFGNVIINTVCLIVMLMLWYQNRNKYSGLFYWVIDWFLQAGGALLIALRGTVPIWASTVLSNSMIVGGTLILYFGLCRFAGKKNALILNYVVWVVFAIFILIHSYFVFVRNDLTIRSYNTSIGLSLACLMGMWLMFKGASPEIRRISKGTGISLAAVILISLIRIIGFSFLPQTGNDFLQSGMFDTLLVLLLVGATVFLVLNLVLMANRRLYMESKQWEGAVIKSAEERLELERKAQNISRLAFIGEMAAGIAHEINNPLTPILGFTDMLLKRDLPVDVKGDLQIIRDSARRTADVTRRLLLFARQSKPMRTLSNINEVVETALQLRADHLKTNNIKVITELDLELPATLIDAGQMQQVVLNLIVNAEYSMVHAHEGGNLLIKTEKMGNIIRVSVKDDGSGISNENMEKLFTPFFTTKKAGEGTGLGLSVCHGIVAEHNGRIYAESEAGKGAAFIVELPIVMSPN